MGNGQMTASQLIDLVMHFEQTNCVDTTQQMMQEDMQTVVDEMAQAQAAFFDFCADNGIVIDI